MIDFDLTRGAVSVIIPCYNASKYIFETIQSVLNQTCIVENIIVIDDGSTDNSLDILRQFGSKIIILHHENGENKGQAMSLNLGLQHVDSEFVAFLDADDLWDENKLACQVDVLKKTPDCLLCYTNGHVVDEEGRYIYPIIPAGFEEHNRVGDILLDCYIRTPSMAMVRRSLFDKVGFFSESFCAPDHDMWIRASEVGKFYFLDRDLVGYRQHPGQLSVCHARKMWQGGFLVLQYAEQRFSYPKIFLRKRKAVLHYRLGVCDFNERKVLRAMSHFVVSFGFDPWRSVRTLFSFLKNY